MEVVQAQTEALLANEEVLQMVSFVLNEEEFGVDISGGGINPCAQRPPFRGRSYQLARSHCTGY